MDPGQSCRRRHAVHCGRNFGTNEATANNNKPSSSSPRSSARESSPLPLFFRFPAGLHVPSPCQLAAGRQSHSLKASLRSAGLSAGDRCLAGTAHSAQAARPLPISAELLHSRRGSAGKRTGFVLNSWGWLDSSALLSYKKELGEGSGEMWRSTPIKGLHPHHLLSSTLHSSITAGASKRFLPMQKKPHKCSASFSLETPSN